MSLNAEKGYLEKKRLTLFLFPVLSPLAPVLIGLSCEWKVQTVTFLYRDCTKFQISILCSPRFRFMFKVIFMRFFYRVVSHFAPHFYYHSSTNCYWFAKWFSTVCSRININVILIQLAFDLSISFVTTYLWIW